MVTTWEFIKEWRPFGGERFYVPILSIPYRSLPGKRRLLPLCELSVISHRGSVQVDVIADSGADFPIFHERTADDLGISLESAPIGVVRYGGSQEIARCAEVSLSLGERPWNAEIFFVKRLDLPYYLMGRNGFLDQFDLVRFIESPRTATPRIEFLWS